MAPLDPRDAIREKLSGGELSPAVLQEFIRDYVAGDVTDAQATALLAGVMTHGMTSRELSAVTAAMLRSGSVLTWSADGGPVVDKHSTGGVGDKVSLPLAPALAACGARVPMVSGRGLGHTGGTLDKLEAVPGLSTELSLERLRAQVEDIGLAIVAQTAELVPADKRLYALRDHTGLVACRPLIASSILSKKLAEGLDALVLDVKYGSGAFLPDPEEGRKLAHAMSALAAREGLPCVVWQTAMDRPLGRAVGHALEIEETFACLDGEGPPDLRELVVAFGGELLAVTGIATDREDGEARIAGALDGGVARERFEAMLSAQGGDADPARLPRALQREAFLAPASGRFTYRDVRAVGQALAALGGGRRRAQDPIDPAVGLVWLSCSGDEVKVGEPLAEIHHGGGRGLAEVRSRLSAAIRVGDEGPAPGPLLLARHED